MLKRARDFHNYSHSFWFVCNTVQLVSSSSALRLSVRFSLLSKFGPCKSAAPAVVPKKLSSTTLVEAAAQSFTSDTRNDKLRTCVSAWILGWFMCKAVAYIQGVSVAASVYSLVAVSLDRYVQLVRFLYLHRDSVWM